MQVNAVKTPSKLKDQLEKICRRLLPRWLWPEEEDTGYVGPDGSGGGAWAWGGGMV